MAIAYDPFSASDRDDPYPVYRTLRDEAPVHWSPQAGVFSISRHEDVLFVLKHPELFSSRAMFTMMINGGREGPPPLSWGVLRFLALFLLRVRSSPWGFPKARNLIAEDPPIHGPLRNVVNRGFTPRRIEAWEPRIRAVVSEQVSTLLRGEAFDVVHDLAIPLPVTIIAEMLGVEPERRDDFKRWSDAIITGTTGSGRARPFDPAFVDPVLQFLAYLRGVVKRSRRRPGDDLVSVILAEGAEDAALSDPEVLVFILILLVAGNETTTNLIGNAVHALLDHPAALARVQADPSLVPRVVEEALRWDSPIQLLFRTARREVELHGVRIPEGAQLVVLLGSANRDERRFAEPDRFDIERDARGHLAFGFGEHFCLGAALARLEARVALELLVPALGRFERSTSRREFVDSFLVRGPRRLELRPAA